MSVLPVNHNPTQLSGPSRAGRGFVMLLPVILIAGAVMWIGGPGLRDRLAGVETRSSDSQVRTEPDPVEMGGYRARFTYQGSAVQARLAPLHASPERLAFDGQASAGRLGLRPGQPWRLELAREGEGQGPAGWDLADVRIAAGGASLQPLDSSLKLKVDPLAVLLAPDPAGLRADEPLVLWLWGPKFEATPYLEAWGLRIELEADTWTASGEDEALMRLEPLR
ncbi:MAG: hypothetical protein ACI8QC_001773 [Planctomycetota bacterium]